MGISTILVVDDRVDIRHSSRWLLEQNDYHVLDASNPAEAKDILGKEDVSVILLDMNYSKDTTSGEEGIEFLDWIKKNQISIPTVAMTAWKNEKLVERAKALGAYDFIGKPWENERLLQILSNGISLNNQKQKTKKLQLLLNASGDAKYEWRSECMVSLLSQMRNVASTDATIFLGGENGTGKSELAKYIHDHSLRRDESFVCVNMGAISDSLFESEMFGHRKGSFTDAKSHRIGRVELAEAGTLFLDEIANIPLSQQPKVLRVLETGEYEVLGSSETVKADVRLISASNGNFEKLIQEEKFREDLFYRINIISFLVPPLRQRKDDLIPLANYFIHYYAKKYAREPLSISESAAAKIMNYHWPGNIREFSSVISRALLLGGGGVISDIDINVGNSPSVLKEDIPLMRLEDVEALFVRRAMQVTNGNVDKAGEILGKSKASMYRMLKKHNVQ